MSRLNLKFKIYRELLVGNIGEINHLSMSKPNLKFKIFSEILVGDCWGVNRLSMSKLNLKFQIFSEILVGENVGGLFPRGDHSQNMTLGHHSKT